MPQAPGSDTDVKPGDVVLARGTSGQFHAVVVGLRLGRLVVERCDGRPSAPLSLRDVLCVFRSLGPPAPGAVPAATERKRPTGQMRFEV